MQCTGILWQWHWTLPIRTPPIDTLEQSLCLSHELFRPIPLVQYCSYSYLCFGRSIMLLNLLSVHAKSNCTWMLHFFCSGKLFQGALQCIASWKQLEGKDFWVHESGSSRYATHSILITTSISIYHDLHTNKMLASKYLTFFWVSLSIFQNITNS